MGEAGKRSGRGRMRGVVRIAIVSLALTAFAFGLPQTRARWKWVSGGDGLRVLADKDGIEALAVVQGRAAYVAPSLFFSLRNYLEDNKQQWRYVNRVDVDNSRIVAFLTSKFGANNENNIALAKKLGREFYSVFTSVDEYMYKLNTNDEGALLWYTKPTKTSVIKTLTKCQRELLDKLPERFVPKTMQRGDGKIRQVIDDIVGIRDEVKAMRYLEQDLIALQAF